MNEYPDFLFPGRNTNESCGNCKQFRVKTKYGTGDCLLALKPHPVELVLSYQKDFVEWESADAEVHASFWCNQYEEGEKLC